MALLAIYCRTSTENENSIEQQKQAGIKFASQNRLDFEVYEDEGKSGYKLSDDDTDLFKNRPAFSRLYQDIKNKKISAVWVWEQSRLSRNQYASAKLFYEFEKLGIQIFVLDSLYDYKNKENKLMRGILGVMAEFERELIVDRTTRGTRDKINKGTRSYCSLYGYEKTGKDVNGHLIWKPVESEIENIKYAYKRISEGVTLRQLATEIYKNKNMKDKKNKLYFAQKWKKILQHFANTGYTLNTEGLKIYNDFLENKIENLSQLHDPQFYTKSKNYPVKIVSIQKWIKTVEALQIWNRNLAERSKTNKASKDLATGVITCGKCGAKFYSFLMKGAKKKGGKIYEFKYYKHFVKFIGNDCGQKKSFSVKRIDEIFEIFYFLNFAVYDNTKETLAETLRLMKQEQLESAERITTIEKEIKQCEKNAVKFQKALDETDDMGTITVLAKRISTEEEKMKNLKIEKSNKVVELEKLKINTSRTESESVYYNVKNKIDDFFNAKNLEQKRNLLIHAIKNCVVVDNFLMIDTGFNLFVFNTELKFVFDRAILGELKNDQYFKENYLNPLFASDGEYSKDIQEFLNTPKKDAVKKYSEIELIDIENKILLHEITRRLGDYKIKEYRLNNEKTKSLMGKKLKSLKIDYSLDGIKQIISFVE